MGACDAYDRAGDARVRSVAAAVEAPLSFACSGLGPPLLADDDERFPRPRPPDTQYKGLTFQVVPPPSMPSRYTMVLMRCVCACLVGEKCYELERCGGWIDRVVPKQKQQLSVGRAKKKRAKPLRGFAHTQLVTQEHALDLR